MEVVSRHPQETGDHPPNRPHLLFIHGACHNAACWEQYYLPWFSSEGWHAHAITLRGHRSDDEGVLEWSLNDYLDDVNEAIAHINQPVVLIGHSMGGVLAQMAFASNVNVKAIALLASSPTRISLQAAFGMFVRAPKATIIGMLSSDMTKLRVAMETFFFADHLEDALRDKFRSQLVSESRVAVDDVFSREPAKHPKSDDRPVLVIAGTDDWSIPLSEHRKDSETYRTPLILCKGAHDLMLDPDWSDSATTIRNWLVTHRLESADVR
ncbi:MAG: alpha/beta hydrolase [Halioglobus sp.]